MAREQGYMISIIAVLFIAVVLLGLYLVVTGKRHRKRNLKLGLSHAALAVAATVLLFMRIIDGPTDKLVNSSALFFIFALVGGGMVYALTEKNSPPPMAMVSAHAIMGIVGMALIMISLRQA